MSSNLVIFSYFFWFFFLFSYLQIFFNRVFFRRKYVGFFCVDNILLDAYSLRFMSLGQVYNFIVPVDSVLFIVNGFRRDSIVNNFVYWSIWNNEVKFLYTMIFSRLFLIFFDEPCTWDSEGNIIISYSIFRYVDSSVLDVDLGVPDRYSTGLEGYLLSLVLHDSGLRWFFSQVYELTFTSFWFEDYIGDIDMSLREKLIFSFNEPLLVAFLFLDWRNFLLDLWFNNIFFYSNISFSKLDVLKSLILIFQESRFCEIFDFNLKVNFEFLAGLLYDFCLFNFDLSFEKNFFFNSLVYFYRLKRRV